MSSLSARLLVSVSLLLILFFGATIVVLDVAFRQAGEQNMRQTLAIASADPWASYRSAYGTERHGGGTSSNAGSLPTFRMEFDGNDFD